MNNDDEWSKKLNWLVNNELPQRVSRGRIPDERRKKVDTIDSVAKMAIALGRNRQALYTQTKPLLADIQWFYRLEENRRCCTELAHGALGDFVAAFNAWHKDFADDAPPQPPARVEERRAGARLARGPRQEPVRSTIAGLASIEIEGYQFGPGTADMEIVVSCGTPMLAGINTALESALIELDCGPAAMSAESHRQWLGNSDRKVTNGRGQAVSVSFGGGFWRLTAENGSIGTLVLEPGFVALAGLAPGDEVTVRLGTWLMDMSETEPDGEELAAYLADGVALVTPEGTRRTIPVRELSALKRRVVRALQKTLIPNENGYVAVACHTMQVVETPDE